MRQILVNHARDRNRLKRGGGRKPVSLDQDIAVSENEAPDLKDLDEALEALCEVDSRLCNIVELRFFTGLTIDETARVVGVSPTTVKNDWTLAKAWLRQRMSRE